MSSPLITFIDAYWIFFFFSTSGNLIAIVWYLIYTQITPTSGLKGPDRLIQIPPTGFFLTPNLFYSRPMLSGITTLY